METVHTTPEKSGVSRNFLFLDYETYSATELKDCGLYRYMEDPDFEVMLLAYAFGEDPVKVVDIKCGEDWPADFKAAIDNPAITKVARNANFERQATFTQLGIYCKPEQWLDTMILAAQCGLPMSLEGTGAALGFDEDQAKMKSGKALIRYFCKPCKPTKTNGQRTRNLPEHAPEKWDEFKEYCGQDVVSDRNTFRLLQQWTPSEVEHRFWCLDARINENGMKIDRQLALNAVAMDAKYKEELTETAVALTGLENPKSVSQIKNWLKDQEGLEFPSLNKKVIADVVAQLQSDKAKEFMSIRSELSKSSTSKYEAMLRSVCRDDHVKGCFQFYGANRTGRFAGRIVQLQNLPQNHLPDLEQARELVRGGKYTALKFLYDGVSKPLSELIRTALIPEADGKIMVADFSAIEARVVAWIAGEQWRLDLFNEGGDIYCASASQMFKVPVVKHGVNGELRQKGKVAELACIAEGQKVLTDHGLVRIEEVTTDMKLWDGEEWVTHDGVVLNGVKEVLSYGGLEATTEHIVWAEVEGQARQVRFGDAAARSAHLVKTGNGGHPLWLGGDHQCREEMERKMESLLCADPLHELREGAMAGARQPENREVERMSELLATESSPSVVGQTVHCGEAAMYEPQRRRLQELRRTGYRVPISKCDGCLPVHDRDLRTAEQRTGNRQNRSERSLRAGKSEVGYASGELSESTPIPRKVRVYDILNAGPRHRFTVSDVLVHNCGYGGGVNALKAFGADKMGMTEAEMQETVDKWREASPNIVALWKALEKAAIRCVVRHAPSYSTIGNIRFDFEQGILWMTLPSGRRIAYFGAQYGPSKWQRDRKVLSYMGVDQKTKKWARVETWGGKLTENLVQATARDCLRDSMLALEDAGYDIRAHVHDEVIVSEPIGGRSVEDMAEIMGRPLPWAQGLPLRADGYETPFYKKD